jgi:site-specific recombinase XerD
MQLRDAVIELGYAKDWTEQTRVWYKKRLGAFIKWCDEQGVQTLEAVTAPLVRRYIDYLQTRPARRTEKLDSFTVHGHVRAIRALLNWAGSEEMIDENIAHRIKPPTKEKKVLHVLTEKQVELLMRAAGKTTQPLRDTALVSLLLDAGCRATELTSLKLVDVHFEADSAWVLVHGKGRKQRPVALGKRARLALYRYINRERQGEYVFIGRKGVLSAEGLDRLLYRLRNKAGAQHFEGVSVGAHRWRHTQAVWALVGGMNLHALKEKMGHSDIATTSGYLRALSDEQLKQLNISPLDLMGRTG